MLMLPMRDGRTNEQTTSEDRATQLLICEPLSLAIVLAALCFNFLFCHTSKIWQIYLYIRIFANTNIHSYHIRIIFLIWIYSDIRSYHFFDTNIFGYSFVSFLGYKYIRIFIRIENLYSSHPDSDRPSKTLNDHLRPSETIRDHWIQSNAKTTGDRTD